MVHIDFCTHILFQGNFAASIPIQFLFLAIHGNQGIKRIVGYCQILVFEYLQLPCQCNSINKLLLFLGRKVSAKVSEID